MKFQINVTFEKQTGLTKTFTDCELRDVLMENIKCCYPFDSADAISITIVRNENSDEKH